MTADLDRLRSWLVAGTAARLGCDRGAVDPGTRFRDLGLTSVQATGLVSALAVHLGRALSPTIAWDHPTIEELARHLTGAPAPDHRAPDHRAPDHRAPDHRAPDRRAPDPGEPIAVIGLSCRLPGAPDPASFWRLLVDGVDAVGPVPPDRWDAEALYDPDPATPGTLTTRRGGFLDDVAGFDAAFFGISPREAARMDPQQRLVLELAWEAFEDAGIAPRSLRDTRTAVFTGALWSDYARLTGRHLTGIEQHSATGQELSIIAARVSYALGLRGPSIGVTTACSSSLVAVHLACQSLRTGESTLAVAGGVNLLLAPESTVAMSKFGAMSPRGRSAAFDAAADGYVRGEGGGLVVLKPLSRALADGDRVYCLLRGSAVNNDGFSNGLTAPSGAAQQAVLRDALAAAGVDRHDVQYVEAHGTGTRLGDPIEAAALGAVLGAGRPAGAPLLVGSVKSGIGHLEAAAGVAGLIKVALALHHGVLPPTLHFREPHPDIAFDDLRLAVVDGPREWPRPDVPMVAGVSSFGFGGTNCHVVVGAAEPVPAQVVAVAADDPQRLQDAAADAAERCAGAPDLARLAAGVSDGGPYRAAVVARTRAGMTAGLGRVTAGTAARGTAVRPPPRLVAVLGGQGSHWAGMARDLLATEPVFHDAVRRCDEVLAPLAGWSVLDELLAPVARLGRTDVVQPVLTGVQIGLVALLRSWGVEPDAVIGHSVGEVAAAHTAGLLDLRDALHVVHHRSRLMARIDGCGAVAVVDLPVPDATAELTGRAGLSVAGSNSPATTVVAGDPLSVDRLLVALELRGVGGRRVAMGVASHSAHCDPLLAELRAALAPVCPEPGRIPMLSTVEPAQPPACDADYWVRNLRSPVRFADATRHLLAGGPTTFLEIGPHPVLSRAIADTAAAEGVDAVVLPVMRRDTPARDVLLATAARLYEDGRDVHWAATRPVGLPGRARHRARLLPLAAHSGPALRAAAAAVAAAVETGSDLDALCAAPAGVRTDGTHRAAVRFHDADGLRAALRAVQPARTPAGAPARPAWTVPGGPVAWRDVAALAAAEPVFRDAVGRCDALVRSCTGAPLLDGADEPRHAATAVLTARYALAELWRSWGVEPAAVVAGPGGELAAAVIAGGLPLADAVGMLAGGADVDPPTAEPADGPELVLDLPSGSDPSGALLARLGALWTAGGAVDWRRHHAGHRRATPAPYPWQRLRHWLDESPLLPGPRTGAPEPDATAGWLSRVDWTEAAPADRPRPAAVRRWAVLDGDPLAAELAARLGTSAAGAVRPDATDVVLTASPTAAEDTAAGLTGPLRMVQELAATGRPVRLWLLTRSAQAAGPRERPEVAAAAVWGFGRTLALEHPDLWGGLVDLPAEVGPRDLTAAVRHLNDPGAGDQVAVRDGRVLTPRIRAVATGPAAPPTLAREGCHLVTGGLGGVGLHLARWLADRGAGHLVLMGRSAPGAAADAAIEDLRAGGTAVDVVSGDVSDRADVEAVVRRCGADLPALRGVVHAAGVLDDGILLRQDPARFAAVLAPKVAGALHLDALTRGLDLDLFVLCSSFSGRMGSPGQASYTAAAAALDALAVRRQAAGQAGLSIGWGPWDGVGMTAAHPERSRRHWLRRGHRLVGPDVARAVMDRLVPAERGAVGAFRHDPGGPPAPAGAPRPAALDEEVRAAAPGRRRGVVAAVVDRCVATVLGVPDAASVDRAAGLFDLGMDSMMVVALARMLDAAAGPAVAVPDTAPFDHPTADALTAFLLAGLDETPPEPDPDVSDDVDVATALLLAEIAALSDDEALRSLAELTPIDHPRGDMS